MHNCNKDILIVMTWSWKCTRRKLSLLLAIMSYGSEHWALIHSLHRTVQWHASVLGMSGGTVRSILHFMWFNLYKIPSKHPSPLSKCHFISVSGYKVPAALPFDYSKLTIIRAWIILFVDCPCMTYINAGTCELGFQRTISAPYCPVLVGMLFLGGSA